MARLHGYAASASRLPGEGADLRPLSQGLLRIGEPKLAQVESLGEERRSLRERALAADRSTVSRLSLALFWRELMSGSCKVLDCFFSDDRCVLLNGPCNGPPVRFSARRQRLLQAALVSSAQKLVALDLGLAASTVASNAQQALEILGVRSRPSRTHPLLVLAAKAERDQNASLLGSLSFVPDRKAEVRVLSIERPGRCLATAMSAAEFGVMQSLVEGACYETIARQRGTSVRTVANQIASVFRKLRVSGRAELLLRLFECPSEGAMALEKTRASH